MPLNCRKTAVNMKMLFSVAKLQVANYCATKLAELNVPLASAL